MKMLASTAAAVCLTHYVNQHFVKTKKVPKTEQFKTSTMQHKLLQ
jgi:hypothetical protein